MDTAQLHAASLGSTLSPFAAARLLIQALIARGIDTFFGIPGGPVCAVFEAIRLNSAARLIESRHETHAAFAAAVYYRASGRVPVVVVTAGPGATNAVTGIASASLERIPLLLIAGDVAWSASGERMAQDSGPEGIHIEAIYSSITRAQIRAASARSVVSQALAALDAACDPANPGPALFVLPLDKSMETTQVMEVVTSAATASIIEPPSDSAISTAKWLCNAKRPLIVFGAGCRGHEASMLQLADALNVPFVTTPRAKGIVSELHPRSLRNAGMVASLWARRYTSQAVDVCLVLGSDLDDTSMGPTPYVGRNGRLIHVDLDAGVLGRNLHAALAVRADVGAFARAVAREVVTRRLSNPHAQSLLDETRDASPFDVAAPELDGAAPIRPHRLLMEIEAAVGPRARFITDIGEHMLFALHYLTAKSPDAFYLQLNLGSMASGIAGAIGLALADRSRRVVCIAGDGGMQIAGMEALVAMRERLPILFVVFNDGRYNMVHHGMQQIFGAASEYSMPPVDFTAWAKSFGMPALTIAQPGHLNAQVIDGLLEYGGPALIDARIDAATRIRGGGRVEALQQMSMLSNK